MPWYDGLEDILKRDEPLAGRTTFGIGGSADMLLEPGNDDQFAAAWTAARRSGQPVHVLGGGSNVLIRDDGVRGIVISTRRMKDRNPVKRGDHVVARAGMPLRRVVRWAMDSGLAGLECLVGIPGTVGGAVHMNAGGKHGYIGERVHSLWCVSEDGSLVCRSAGDVQWEYRRTSVWEPIVAVEFLLQRDSKAAILERSRAILAQKARSQPMGKRSAGCFFKNPTGQSAGRLIDEAGLKGLTVGGARVSEKHANFIVNLGNATAADVLSLSGTIRDRVRARAGIVLENEVCCWPQPRV